jgi:DNA repair protein RecO (recombination protein O)
MELADEALVLTARPFGEHGAVVRMLCFDHGLATVFVAGARSRTRRALLQPGTRVAVRLRAPGADRMPTAAIEPVAVRSLFAFDPHAAAAITWLVLLTAETLAERAPARRLADALDALIGGLDAGIGRVAARAGVARFELLLLSEQGFGLDLDRCAMGGPADDIGFVSPASGRGLSRLRAAGQPWAAKLLPLPAFLLDSSTAAAEDAEAALRLSGHFIARHWFGQQRKLAAARATFIGMG